jgi:hypothetical protein
MCELSEASGCFVSAYSSYYTADRLVGASGLLAVVCNGFTMSLIGGCRASWCTLCLCFSSVVIGMCTRVLTARVSCHQLADAWSVPT